MAGTSTATRQAQLNAANAALTNLLAMQIQEMDEGQKRQRMLDIDKLQNVIARLEQQIAASAGGSTRRIV